MRCSAPYAPPTTQSTKHKAQSTKQKCGSERASVFEDAHPTMAPDAISVFVP
jgi:hypothetical protein